MDIKVDKHTVIVFDLDDTLYNEIEYLKSAYRHIASLIDSENSLPLYREMFAMYRNNENVFAYLSETYNVEKEYLINVYRNHIPELQLFEGIGELIKAIIEKQGKLAIITDGRVKTQMAKIEALGIKDFFSKIVISEAVGSEKPAALNYKSVEAALPANKYYYIGDNVKKDFVTANAIGWQTIGLIDNGLNIHNQSTKDIEDRYLPHSLIQNYKEIHIV